MSSIIDMKTRQERAEGVDNEDMASVILAFLARTIPLSACDYSSDDEFHHGAQLIEQLARCYEFGSSMPEWRAAECADVVRYVHSVEPRAGHCFCNDHNHTYLTNITCGFHLILQHVEHRLREMETQS
jgi:hypothetical protein